ncbi:MAG: shikimate dehydrogenase [Promethearchaeota archaeon]
MSERKFISAQTMILCVIGYPIEHSMSPIMHNAAIQDLGLNYIYLSFAIHPSNLKHAVNGFRALDVKGINVTIPYKEKIIKYLDEIDPIAQKIGAVNTIKNEEGYLIAKNTDGIGGKKALIEAGYKISGKNFLFIGAGGAARALCYVISDDANKIVIANRTEKRAVKLANEIKKQSNCYIVGKSISKSILKEIIKNSDIVINTTPIGMYPLVNKSPIPPELLHSELIIFDIVYNPLKTKLLKDAVEKGCRTLGGLDMLVNQGALAFEWWTNKKPNIKLMKDKIIETLEMKE